MNYLTRWDPVRDMVNMRETMDRLFESMFDGQQMSQQIGQWGLPLDVVENEGEFVVKASIPGINPDDLEITFSDHNLIIKGEIKEDRAVEESRYQLRERRFGRFERSLYLPTEVKADQIEANYDAGVLSLRLPKSEEVKPKRISIKSGSGQKVLEGHFESNKN
jgi:HSP20 family protein